MLVASFQTPCRSGSPQGVRAGVQAFGAAGSFGAGGASIHSDALHVVERYTRVSPYHLMYEATIEDPEVFTRPWKISFPLYRRMEKDVQQLEFKCVPWTEELLFGRFRKTP